MKLRESKLWKLCSKVFPVLLLLILATLSVPVALTFITRSTSVSLLLSFFISWERPSFPVFRKIKGLEFLTEWFTETWLMYTDFAQQATYSQAPKMILVSLVTIVVSSALGMFIFQNLTLSRCSCWKLFDYRRRWSCSFFTGGGSWTEIQTSWCLFRYGRKIIVKHISCRFDPSRSHASRAFRWSIVSRNPTDIECSDHRSFSKSDQRDKVSLLAAGADDYVTKPFDIEELLLRIGIQLRHQTSVQVKDLSQRIYYKEILLDKESRDVNVNGGCPFDRKRIRSAEAFRTSEKYFREQIFMKQFGKNHIW